MVPAVSVPIAQSPMPFAEARRKPWCLLLASRSPAPTPFAEARRKPWCLLSASRSPAPTPFAVGAAEEATEGRTKPRQSPTTFMRASASFVFSPVVGLCPFISLLCCASYIRITVAPRQALDDEKHCSSTHESLSPLQYVSKSSFRLFVYSCFYLYGKWTLGPFTLDFGV